MQLTKHRLRGWFDAFPNEVSLDLESLGPGLISIVGDNGAGKTVLMESIVAAIYGEFVTKRRGLYAYAQGTDAYLESTWRHQSGDDVRLRLSVDAVRRHTERQIFRAGVPLTTGKEVDYLRIGRELFGSKQLFLTAAFADQRKANWFLALGRDQRKQVLSDLLNLDYLEKLAQQSRVRRSSLQGELAALRQQVEAQEAANSQANALKDELTTLQGSTLGAAVSAAQSAEKTAIVDLEQARNVATNIARIQQVLDGITSERRQVQSRIDASHNSRRERAQMTSRRREDLRLILDETAASIEESFTLRRAQLEDRISSLRATVEREPEVNEAAELVTKYRGEYSELQKAERDAETVRQDAVRAQGDLKTAQTVADRANAEVTRQRDALGRQASAIEHVGCSAADEWQAGDLTANLWQTCPLLRQAREAREALTSLPEKPPELVALRKAKRQSDAKACEVLALEKISQRRRERMAWLEEEGRRFAGIAGGKKEIETAKVYLDQDEARLEGLADELQTALSDLSTRQATARGELQRLDFEEMDAVATIDESLRALNAELEAIDGRYTNTACELETAQDSGLSVEEAEEFLADATAYRQQLEGRAAAQTQRLTEIQTLLRVMESQADVGEVKAKADKLAQDLANLNLIEEGLGRKGAQALRIDAALPQIASLSNDLLSSYSGTPFSVRLETQREKATKGGEFIETLDVLVYKDGVERHVEDLSGGEDVIVAETISITIGIMNAKQHGHRIRTVCRDETTGALASKRAPNYIRLLRRAMAPDLADLQNLLYITHNPEVGVLADVQLQVGGGAVRPVSRLRAA